MSDEGRKPLPSPVDDPDVQEALSRRHSPEVVRLLRLRSGRFAVFNHIGELCGMWRPTARGKWAEHSLYVDDLQWPPSCWFPAKPPPKPAPSPAIDLEDLGLT